MNMFRRLIDFFAGHSREEKWSPPLDLVEWSHRVNSLDADKLAELEEQDRARYFVLGKPYWGTPQMFVLGMPVASPVVDNGPSMITEPLCYSYRPTGAGDYFWIGDGDNVYPLHKPKSDAA
jgi:hypothetical protein